MCIDMKLHCKMDHVNSRVPRQDQAPRDITVAVINLNTDPQVKTNLKDLKRTRAMAPGLGK